MTAIKRAIKAAGGLSALASKLKVEPQVVSNWRARRRVPADQCAAVEQATEGAVTCYELRPDVFPKPAEQATA